MEEIDLKELIGVFWKKKILIVVVVVIFALLGLIYSNISKSPIYESSTSLILIPEKSEDPEAFADYYHITNNDEIIDVEKTYNETSRLTAEMTINSRIFSASTTIATSQKVANKVIENLDLDMSANDLISSITVTPTVDTQNLKISVTNSNPEMACNLANEISKAFVEEAGDIYNTEAFYILDEAIVPTNPSNDTSPLKNVVIFAFIGAVLVAGYILVMYMFDTSVKSSQDVENVVKLSTLATIFFAGNSTDKKIKLIDDTKYPESEMFRNLRTNIQSVIEYSGEKLMLITSADSNSGKSYIAANLAYAYSKLNKKVLIIDANIRNGVQDTIFDLKSKSGISNFLSNKNGDIREYVQETKFKNLYLISSGEKVQNPSDLLAMPNMKDALEILKQSFDIIILDAPACVDASDSFVLARLADLTILVVAQNATKVEDLEKAKSAIENVEGKILGVVLNKAPFNTKKNIFTCFKKEK